MTDLKEIIGMQCTYRHGQKEWLWDDNNTIRCEIVHAYAYVDQACLTEYLEKRRNLIIELCLIPIEEHNLDDFELNFIRNGVYVDRVRGIKPLIKK